MLEKLKSFIESHQLLNKTDKLAIAVSGGRDSVLAAHLVNELQIPFVIVHCNYNLRAEESDGDEQFVRDLQENLEYASEVLVKQFNYDESSESVQLWARNRRYEYFEELFRKGEFTKLITAHHKDDDIETFLMNAMRGSGMAGLKGIPLIRDYVIRPLMCFDRDEINSHITKKGIVHREDSTNSKSDYTRNKIRNELAPFLDSAFSNWREGFSKSTQILKQEHELWTFLLSEIRENCLKKSTQNVSYQVDMLKIQTYPQSHVILYTILNDFGFNMDQCHDILNAETGAVFYSGDHELLKDRDLLKVRKTRVENDRVIAIQGPGTYTLGRWQLEVEPTSTFEIPFSDFEELISLDMLDWPLDLRFYQEGDKIQPLGMEGRKLVSDYFTDKKIDRFGKTDTPLVCRESEVIVVAGIGISERVKASKDSKNLYFLSFRQLD